MRSFISRQRYFVPVLLSTLTFMGACAPMGQVASRPDAAEIPQTSIKHQSIGNCWAYAVNGWIESLHKKATGNDINLSESWISYWNAYWRLVWDETGEESPSTGGGMELAAGIISQYGYIMEGDFIPEEAEEAFSQRQDAAMDYIEKQAKPGGRLFGKNNRTEENIIKELNAAFGVDIKEAMRKAKPAETLIVDKDGTNLKQILADGNEKQRWHSVVYPLAKKSGSSKEELQARRLELIKRVQRAINDDMPVVMSFWVAMGAIDKADGGFKVEAIQEGNMGTQGGHMVVVTDYTADNVPGVGSVEEGPVSPEIRAAALDGTLRYFKVKNSWGINRAERGLTDGYSRIYLNYMLEEINWDIDGDKFTAPSVQEFILPPGY